LHFIAVLSCCHLLSLLARPFLFLPTANLLLLLACNFLFLLTSNLLPLTYCHLLSLLLLLRPLPFFPAAIRYRYLHVLSFSCLLPICYRCLHVLSCSCLLQCFHYLRVILNFACILLQCRKLVIVSHSILLQSFLIVFLFIYHSQVACI